jgi:hypothetical protein
MADETPSAEPRPSGALRKALGAMREEAAQPAAAVES